MKVKDLIDLLLEVDSEKEVFIIDYLDIKTDAIIGVAESLAHDNQDKVFIEIETDTFGTYPKYE